MGRPRPSRLPACASSLVSRCSTAPLKSGRQGHHPTVASAHGLWASALAGGCPIYQSLIEPAQCRPQERHLSLALQGGGSLGAFAWGVLDRLLEEEHLTFDAVSGASAGAVNAVILAGGLLAGGKPEARGRLDRFWERMSQMAPPKRSAAAALFADLVSHLVSPYQLNPLNLNPLKRLLSAEVDFEALRANPPLKLLIAATAVSTGRLQIFRETELTREMVLASASLPLLSQAVPIGGERY